MDGKDKVRKQRQKRETNTTLTKKVVMTKLLLDMACSPTVSSLLFSTLE